MLLHLLNVSLALPIVLKLPLLTQLRKDPNCRLKVPFSDPELLSIVEKNPQLIVHIAHFWRVAAVYCHQNGAGFLKEEVGLGGVVFFGQVEVA